MSNIRFNRCTIPSRACSFPVILIRTQPYVGDGWRYLREESSCGSKFENTGTKSRMNIRDHLILDDNCMQGAIGESQDRGSQNLLHSIKMVFHFREFIACWCTKIRIRSWFFLAQGERKTYGVLAAGNSDDVSYAVPIPLRSQQRIDPTAR